MLSKLNIESVELDIKIKTMRHLYTLMAFSGDNIFITSIIKNDVDGYVDTFNVDELVMIRCDSVEFPNGVIVDRKNIGEYDISVDIDTNIENKFINKISNGDDEYFYMLTPIEKSYTLPPTSPGFIGTTITPGDVVFITNFIKSDINLKHYDIIVGMSIYGDPINIKQSELVSDWILSKYKKEK